MRCVLVSRDRDAPAAAPGADARWESVRPSACAAGEGDCRARTARGVLISRDPDAPVAAHSAAARRGPPPTRLGRATAERGRHAACSSHLPYGLRGGGGKRSYGVAVAAAGPQQFQEPPPPLLEATSSAPEAGMGSASTVAKTAASPAEGGTPVQGCLAAPKGLARSLLDNPRRLCW